MVLSKAKLLVWLNVLLLLIVGGFVGYRFIFQTEPAQVVIDDPPDQVEVLAKDFETLAFTQRITDFHFNVNLESIIVLGSELSEIIFVDPERFEIADTVPVRTPRLNKVSFSNLEIDDANPSLIFTTTTDGHVLQISPETYQVFQDQFVGGKPSSMVGSLTYENLFVLNQLLGQVDVFNIGDFTKITELKIARGASDMAMDNDGEFIYTIGLDSGIMNLISVQNMSLVGSYHVGITPTSLLAHPQKDLIYILLREPGELMVFDQMNNRLRSVTTVVSDPIDMVIDEAKDVLYVLSATVRGVGVVDLKTQKMKSVIPLGSAFESEDRFTKIELDKKNNRVYILDRVYNQILKLELD